MNKSRIFILLILVVGISLNAQLPLTQDNKSPFVDVVKNIRESVVNIRVEYEESLGSGSLPFNEEFFRFFFPDLPQSQQPQTRQSVALGSGFIFKKETNDIYIITNHHVVGNGSKGEIIVTLADKAKYEAEIVGLDAQTDLAVIRIVVEPDEEVTVVPLGDSDQIEIGDWAIAIGNPFGQLGLERTVTVGVISATGRANLQFGANSPIYQDYIQTDAAINPGNSGGPLINIKGEVIGVNAAITSTTGGNLGIGFAIPVNLAKKVTKDLINEGVVIRAYIGILPQEIDYELQKSLKLNQISGVLVAKVEKDTPAEEAGIKKGDVILRFNEKKVPNVAKFRIEVANGKIGKKIPVTLIRKGNEKTLYVTLVQRPDDLVQVESKTLSESTSQLGIEVEEIYGDFASNNNIDEDSGIIISDVENISPGADAGLRPGDIILEINQIEIHNLKDYREIIDNNEEDILLFYVKTANESYRFVTVKLD